MVRLSLALVMCESLFFAPLVGLAEQGQVTEQPILRGEENNAIDRRPFSELDQNLLDEIQHGCFEFFWQEVGDPVPLVKDRFTNNEVSSLAGVGFQLSSLPIGVKRGWITREQGEQRALAILQALIPRDDNKKFGVYLHYVDLNTGGMHQAERLQMQASTVDHALLQAGAMVAAVYFGGEINELVDQLIAEADWKVFEVGLNEYTRRGEPETFISFGWRPDDEGRDLTAPGQFRPWSWWKASDEELLVTFQAVGSPNPRHAVEPNMYYRLRRVIKRHDEMLPFVVSWGGQVFTYFFAHCWIDYGRFDADDPQAFGSDQPDVDWFENSRRAMLTHRQRSVESAVKYKTFGPNRWGMSPAADIEKNGRVGYIVQSIRPNMEERDNFCGGTVTPYAAGSAIMFVPELAVAALREFRTLRDAKGVYVAWRELNEGGYGLLDSFNLERQEFQGTPDYLSIDDGPMLLAIENARTGLIWNLFMKHPTAQLAVDRLKFKTR